MVLCQTVTLSGTTLCTKLTLFVSTFRLLMSSREHNMPESLEIIVRNFCSVIADNIYEG